MLIAMADPAATSDDRQQFNRHQMIKAARWLVGHTVDDLRSRSLSENEYEILGAAGVLRRTLIDQHLLVDVARPKYQAQPIFAFTENTEFPTHASGFTQVVYFLDEGTFRVASQTATLKEFLTSSVGSVGGISITVRAFIQHFANVEGGVHIGLAKTEESQALRDIFSFRSKAWRHGLALLADIAAVTATAIEPLASPTREVR